MKKKIGGLCRDQFFEKYLDYLRHVTDEERKKAGKKPYSDVTIKTMATDTFYLEKHEDREFKEWLKSKESLEEARQALIKHFIGHRNNPEKDAEYYIQRMVDFKAFLDNNTSDMKN